MQLTILDTQISKEGQSAYFTQILDARLPHRTFGKLKIEIRTDRVSHQAYARILKYDGNEWQRLAELLELKTDLDLAYKPGAPIPADFNQDQARLLTLATKILE